MQDDNRNVAPVDAGWEKMEMLLDNEMPVRRTFAIWWWMSGAAAVALLIVAVGMLRDVPGESSDEYIAELKSDSPLSPAEPPASVLERDNDESAQAMKKSSLSGLNDADVDRYPQTQKRAAGVYAERNIYRVADESTPDQANMAGTVVDVIDEEKLVKIQNISNISNSIDVVENLPGLELVMPEDMAKWEASEKAQTMAPVELAFTETEHERGMDFRVQADLLSDNAISYGGWRGGVMLDFPISRKLDLTTGFQYAFHKKDGFANAIGSPVNTNLSDPTPDFGSAGIDFRFTNESDVISADLIDELHMLYVPIQAKYAVSRHFSVMAGMQLGWLMNSRLKDLYTIAYNTNLGQVRIVGEGGTTNSRDLFNKIDVQPSVGFAYHVDDKWTIGLQYQHGLVNIIEGANKVDLTDESTNPGTGVNSQFRINALDNRAHNRYFSLFFSYRLEEPNGA